MTSTRFTDPGRRNLPGVRPFAPWGNRVTIRSREAATVSHQCWVGARVGKECQRAASGGQETDQGKSPPWSRGSPEKTAPNEKDTEKRVLPAAEGGPEPELPGVAPSFLGGQGAKGLDQAAAAGQTNHRKRHDHQDHGKKEQPPGQGGPAFFP